MAKTLSQLLRTVMKGDPGAFSSWFTYIILVCFITSAAFWATRLNKSLQLFPALIIVPLMQVRPSSGFAPTPSRGQNAARALASHVA